MKRLILNKKTQINWPSNWYDLSWGQVNRLLFTPVESDYELFVMSTLSNLTVEFWRKYRNVDAYLQLYAEAAQWLNDTTPLDASAIQEEYKKNRSFLWEGKEYRFPLDMGFMEVGLYYDGLNMVRALTQKESPTLSDYFDVYADLTKLMIHRLTHDEYDFTEAKEISVDHLQWVQVAGFGSFFLQRLSGWKNGTRKTWIAWAIPLRNRLRALWEYRRNTVFLSRYAESHKV
jgi:hypothetical protein